MAEGVGTIARHTFNKKGNLKQCQNYPTLSNISHPSSTMLRGILNRLKARAVKLMAEEQTGFRPGRSTVDKTFNNRVITEKHLQHQCNLSHNFIGFKKAFDRLRHACLRQVLRSFNIAEGLVQAIQALYENSSSAVLVNSKRE